MPTENLSLKPQKMYLGNSCQDATLTAQDGKKVDLIFGYANIAFKPFWWKIGSMAEKEMEFVSLVS